MEAFELDKPHVIAPDIGTPACLFAAANHPGVFKSLVIGSGATDHTDILGDLDRIVNAPSLEPFKDLTGEQFVRAAVEDMKKYKLPRLRAAGLHRVLCRSEILGCHGIRSRLSKCSPTSRHATLRDYGSLSINRGPA